jgi:hypothetical protein
MCGTLASTDCSRRTRAVSSGAAARTQSSVDTTAPLPSDRTARSLPAVISYLEYHHARAGFTLRYPSFLSPGVSPHNNNGISFRGDGGIALSVMAAPDLYPDQTNEEQLRMAIDRRGGDGTTQITEQRALADGFAAAGTHGTRAFYERRLRTDHRVVTLTFDYDGALRDAMSPVIDEVVRSVRVDRVRADEDRR